MISPDINDELLSAFLDSELSPEEMERVRNALATQPDLAARLSVLNQADRLVQQHAHGLDQQPMPDAVLALLSDDQPAGGTGTTVTMPPARPCKRPARYILPAFAATLILAVGLTWLLSQERTQPGLSTYEQQLAQVLSGNTVHLEGEISLISHFSFQDRDGRYCRQYRLTTPATSTENIACHGQQGWIQVTSVDTVTSRQGDYQTASQPVELESIVDEMIQGEILTLSEEQTQIQRNWQ